MGTGLFTTNRIVLTPEYNREVSKGPLRARDLLCCESDRTTIQRTSPHRQRHTQCIHFLLYYPKSAGRRCLPLLSVVLILILGTLAGFSFWQASKLTPPRNAEKWLPPNHMMQMVWAAGWWVRGINEGHRRMSESEFGNCWICVWVSDFC